jgi:hypothetical protein
MSLKTDPAMLAYDATPGPWGAVIGATNGGGRLIIESYDFGAIAVTSLRGAPTAQSRLSPDSPYFRSSSIAVVESNARLSRAHGYETVKQIRAVPRKIFKLELTKGETKWAQKLKQT